MVELRRRLQAGELGRIFQVTATRLGPFPDRIRDVGVVVDLAPHDLDVMRFLLGSDPVRLYAETEQRIHTDHEDLFVGRAEVRQRRGRAAEHQLADADQAAHHRRHRRARDVPRRLHQPGARLRRQPGYRDGHRRAQRSARPIARREPLVVELEAFAAAVREGGPPPVDPREALVALQLARALVEAANSGTALSGASLEAVLA